MFTLPPLPPKDYYIKEVRQTQISCPDITPLSVPRITQTSLGKYCAPIEYQPFDKLENVEIRPVNPKILNRDSYKTRAFWVDKPGKNDFFLHDIYKNYRVQVEDDYDTRYKHKESVFYRSFSSEMDCIKATRLNKLERKAQYEYDIERAKRDAHERWRLQQIENKQIDDMGLKSCKEKPPFWWDQGPIQEKFEAEKSDTADTKTISSNDLIPLQKRWQDEPDLLKFCLADPCKRRENMSLIARSFHSEACNWYYINYPQPLLRHINKRFA